MKDKLKIFQEFYQKLYNGNNVLEENIENYINVNLKIKLLECDKRILEEEIKEEEIAEVINKLRNGKTPAPNGLDPEYYKHFSSMLIFRLKMF